jgi:hypothetical protein
MSILTPSKEKERLRLRVEKLKEKLPRYWITPFIQDNREYASLSSFLSNVILGRSLHEPTINDIEAWVKKQSKKSIKK